MIPTPTRAAGLAQLDAFVPKAGRAYAAGRNHDLAEDGTGAVSQLSPYLRHRLISEQEVSLAVLAHHDHRACEKFIQEVFWRTYWKGWLEMRPAVWSGYRAEVQAGLNRLQTEAGLRANFDAACRGETEIECFNIWAQQIVATGYLHNHARMWFASIWIFTLGLPWALGADFFLRHLLDGDPASNTLSWRWVAGLQTKGKTYLATPDNIETFTNGRFRPAQASLAHEAPALKGPDHPAPTPIPEPNPPLEGAATGWLLHEDDMLGGFDGPPPGGPMATLNSCAGRSPLAVSQGVTEFTAEALAHAAADAPAFTAPGEVAAWAAAEKLDQIITPYAPVGPAAEALRKLDTALSAHGITLTRLMRRYDRLCWPHATKGFFPFKANIPDFVKEIGRF